MQLDLFSAINEAYSNGLVDNQSVYDYAATKTKTDLSSMVGPVGKNHQRVNTFKRKIRWYQQTLKQQGIIKKLGGGQWQITNEGKFKLTRINMDRYMVAASTDLGAIVWGNSAHVFDKVITQDVSLCLTSPPYLGIERSYGTYNDVDAYINFIVSVLTPIRKRMLPGANMAINLTNDSYIKQSFGARSLYLEKLTLRLAEELNLFLMDRLVWHVANKLPGPRQFISDRHTHLTTKYEPILWLCTDPSQCLADNHRVKTPYSAHMKKLIEQGGEKKHRAGLDNQHKINKGSFANDNGGTIAGNVISIGTTCSENNKLVRLARTTGIPLHSATFPVNLAKFLIKWLCPEEGLTVDPFGGWSTTGSAAESLGMPWLTCELHWEYIKASLSRFSLREGFYVNPRFNDIDNIDIRTKLANVA
jgi:DNA modification methylase